MTVTNRGGGEEPKKTAGPLPYKVTIGGLQYFRLEGSPRFQEKRESLK